MVAVTSQELTLGRSKTKDKARVPLGDNLNTNQHATIGSKRTIGDYRDKLNILQYLKVFLNGEPSRACERWEGSVVAFLPAETRLAGYGFVYQWPCARLKKNLPHLTVRAPDIDGSGLLVRGKMSSTQIGWHDRLPSEGCIVQCAGSGKPRRNITINNTAQQVNRSGIKHSPPIGGNDKLPNDCFFVNKTIFPF